ncbi:MAG: 6,7-dimethyl-8-ribityllumazine synthase [Candidatus Omnitrophica bacterium]|nr:6,7-dimethyl-8-ribityllumazine synthase [Candidatus Omnitrophota bacterium]
MKVVEAVLNAEGKRFAIVVSRFNTFITKRLLDGCCSELRRHLAVDEQIEVYWVPGAYEIPLAAQRLARAKRFDAIICLAAVIRGETSHFEYVASECAKGIAQVSLAGGLPVIFGVITAENLEQAIERAGSKGGNKGEDAARTAVEMVNVLAQIV